MSTSNEPWFSAELWVCKHWLTAPMLTNGMAEQCWAIINNFTNEIKEIP